MLGLFPPTPLGLQGWLSPTRGTPFSRSLRFNDGPAKFRTAKRNGRDRNELETFHSQAR